MPEHDNSEDLFAAPVFGEGEPVRITNSPHHEWPATFSPDGRWVAYDSQESGRREIYVVPFPGLGGRWQASSEGGRFPRWSPDGKRLYFWRNRTLMEVPVRGSGNTLQFGEARDVLNVPGRTGWNSYGMNAKGDAFLVLATDPRLAQAPISLFVNWQDELKRR